MARTKKPKLVTVTRPIFEIYANKYEMMDDTHHLYSSNEDFKLIDYLIKKKETMLLKNAKVKIGPDGKIPESEEHHLFEVEQVDGFYGWVKKFRFETVEIVEEPKEKPEKVETKKSKKK